RPAMEEAMTTGHPLPAADPSALGLDGERLERLYAAIERQIAEGMYPGAQLAFARDGKLAVLRSFGLARVAPEPAPARDDTLWLLYSQTKPLVAAGVWVLADRGALRFHDRMADHVAG